MIYPMSHHRTVAGRPFVECDTVNPDTLTRCGQRSFGSRDRLDKTAEVNLFDLPRNWSVAPYSDSFCHDVRHFFDDPQRGQVIEGHPLAGITGDLHTCPACDRAMARA